MKNVFQIRGQALQDAYQYFDHHIRPLPKTEGQQFDEGGGDFTDNDVDAFRHAYVSGIFTMEIGSDSAAFWGYLNEVFPGGGSSGNNGAGTRNMDFWNNKVGRKYGRKAKRKDALLKMIHDALNRGELIINPTDPRQYAGKPYVGVNSSKPVIVIEESKTGRNRSFLDITTGEILDREAIVTLIKSGRYPGYRVSVIGGMETPVSNRDKISENNLG